MPEFYENQDEIKRKLRNLKKLEMKVRYNTIDFKKIDKKSFCKSPNIELVWNKFFDLKDECTKNVKYSINQLTLMTKDEFKDVINEYFYHVYYEFYKEKGIKDTYFIDTELLTQLGLPIYTDKDELKRKFRELAKIYHPDNGGDSTKFLEIMENYNSLRTKR